MSKIKIDNTPWGPFPVVIVGAEVNGKPTYTTIGAVGCVSQKPVLYISLHKNHYINNGVKENGFFSVNLPSADMVGVTDFCGVASGHKTDKSGVFTAYYDVTGKAPLIQECPMSYLCKVDGQQEMLGFEFFLGEIVSLHVNDDCMTDNIPDALKLDLMVLMGPRYFSLKEKVGEAYKEGGMMMNG
jgi:flavin reductase (DIM6/NTAB) family NADH-FMN oxidoreductase RutF